MRFCVHIFIYLAIQQVHCCPWLYQTTCKSYEEFLNQNQAIVTMGTDKILRSLDVKYSRCGPYNIDIRELTISRAQELFQDGKLTSLQLTTCYLNRIKHMNPYLRAVIEVNPDALSIAQKADSQRQGKSAGAMHGIPILIKDDIVTSDRMQSTAGAVVLEDIQPKMDAEVVKRIRAAGGVILGKANCQEWTGFRAGSDLQDGWSGRGGQAISPYVLTSDPYESSSGSASAVAANLALVAIGTETDGSVIAPASVESLVGIKPTLGKVPSEGSIAAVLSQAVIGPFARTLADAKILFDVLSGSTSEQCSKANTPYRIGVVRDPFWDTSDTFIGKNAPILQSAIKNMEARPELCIVDPVVGDADAYRGVDGPSELIVFNHEFKDSVNKYLKNEVIHGEYELGRSIHTLRDVIKFNIENPAPEGFDQDGLIAAEATDGLKNTTYAIGRLRNIINARAYLNSILKGNNLDAMVTPCQSEYAVLFMSFGAIAGYPYITIPIGINEDGIPVGICFLGFPNSESTLLNIGEILEHVQNGRRKPNFNLNSLKQASGNFLKTQGKWSNGRSPTLPAGWANENSWGW